MQKRRLLLATAVAILLGCGSSDTHADDEKPGDKPPAADKKDDKAPEKKDEAKPAEAKPADKKPGDKDKKDEKHFVATVTDNFGTAPFKIDDADLRVPQVSLLGGESFDHKKMFTVKHGAAEIEVPFEEISKVTFGKTREDRLEVTIEFRSADKSDKQLEGTVKSNLQLGGNYQQRGLKANLKLREIKSLTLEEQK